MPLRTREDCIALCEAHDGCQGWAYELATSQCSLYEEGMSPEGSPGTRIGMCAKRMDVLCNASIFDSGDIPLKSLKGGEIKEVHTIEACEELCEVTEGCDAFTYDSHSLECKLKPKTTAVHKIGEVDTSVGVCEVGC